MASSRSDEATGLAARQLRWSASQDVLLPGLDALRICSSVRQRLTSLKRFWRLARSSATRPEAARCAAEAGLLSSWARLPASLPRARQLLRLLLDAGHFAHPVEQRGDDPLRHGRDGLEHLRKERLVNRQHPHVGDGKALSAVGLHAREGQAGRSSARRGQ